MAYCNIHNNALQQSNIVIVMVDIYLDTACDLGLIAGINEYTSYPVVRTLQYSQTFTSTYSLYNIKKSLAAQWLKAKIFTLGEWYSCRGLTASSSKHWNINFGV